MAPKRSYTISLFDCIQGLAFFVGMLFTSGCYGQQPDTKYLRFTRHNFLATNQVNCIIQDKKEFMWFGTSNGIQRFDGNRWLWIGQQKNSSTSLPDNYVASMMEDEQDRFWVHTATGICLLNRNTFKFTPVMIRFSPQHKRADIRSIVQLKDKRVWLTLVSGGAYYYDETKKEFVSGETLIPATGYLVYQLVYNSDQYRYYLGTKTGIVIYDQRNKQLYHAGFNPENNSLLKFAPAQKRNVTMYLNDRGQLWFSTATIHSCYETRNDKIIFCDSVSHIWGVMGYTTDKTGETWGYGSSITKMNIATGRMELIEQSPDNQYGISFKYGYWLMEDKENTYWLATSHGVFIYNRLYQQFLQYPIKNSVTRKPIRQIEVFGFVELQDSSIVAITMHHEGLYYFDRQFNQLPSRYDIRPFMTDSTINLRCGIKDRFHQLWVGGEGVLLKINTLDGKVEKITDSIVAGQTICGMAEDKNGNIWFGTFNRGIIKREALTGKFSILQNPSSVVKVFNVVNHLLYDGDKYIWATTSQTGLLKINTETNTVEKKYVYEPGNANSFPNCRPRYAIKTAANELMIATQKGIVVMDIPTEKFSLLNSADGLPDNNITAMMKDGKDNIWFASDNGISKARHAGMKVTSYGILEGLTNEIYNEGRAVELSGGRMLFGHDAGFTLFEPDLFINDWIPHDPQITGIRLFDTNLNIDSILNNKDGMKLRYDQNFLTIEFSNMGFIKRYQTEYYYQLEGVDKDWVQTDGKPQATYTYLPGGSYTFKVKCITKSGIESANITSFKITITPPYWQRWWFYVLCLLAVLGIIRLVYHIRNRRRQESEKVRSRIARDLHDDMGSTLSTINILSEMAKTKIDSDKTATRDFINQISDNSNRIMESMDDIVWSINPMNDTMEHMVSRMREFAGYLLEARAITYTFKESDHLKNVNLALDKRHDLFMIFKEAVNNLAKYSECTTADIAITIKKNVLQMQIADNGKGFDRTLITNGNGLVNMQKRARTLNGKLFIHTETNKGTTIKLVMTV